jgi:hypothetical protein
MDAPNKSIPPLSFVVSELAMTRFQQVVAQFFPLNNPMEKEPNFLGISHGLVKNTLK